MMIYFLLASTGLDSYRHFFNYMCLLLGEAPTV